MESVLMQDEGHFDEKLNAGRQASEAVLGSGDAVLPDEAARHLGEAGVGVAQLDRTLTIEHANQDFFRQFGSSATELCGRDFRELVHPSVRRPVVRRFAGLLDGKQHRFSSRLIGVRPDQSPLTGTLTGMVVRGDAPDATAVLVLVHPQDEVADEARVMIPQSKLFGQVDAQILEGIAAGQSTISLASRLYLSRQGVEYHVSGLLRKMRVPNRAALVSRAYSMGVLTVGIWPPKVIHEYVK
ncbi:helix-turn-helix transcriptional regulator [Jidongwangia harbinensis]|uniref:helix-turn-helix transcriptional regulator n=1 Tax=Jidongwangia harbinensis TaxID=2878561 RepID=UPI001CD93D37|nr:LuxR C-terminal-related transcriptional regulator [Jidongwangia harbinensis]MCA2219062.1 LuxR C-terminal-related transcriptional regulator [Jidongwangia harbinensis]